ncbi:MAG: hypothetical protein IIX84_01670 [Oscillospiraceae bacterium]|nr:hypothetical protein [Oscillospiraceae bacterium]
MSLTDHKIDGKTDYVGRDIEGLEDRPLLSPKQLKARFDSLVKDLVVPKFNGLIDELGTPAHTVSDGKVGNIPCFDENGDMRDSGVSHSEIERKRGYAYISGQSNEQWYRIAVFRVPFAVSGGRNIRIDGYSGCPDAAGSGHWSIIATVSYQGNAERKTCRLVLADNGIKADNFDFRQTNDGEFGLWFKPCPNSDYAMFSQVNGERENLELSLFSNDTTPVSGQALSVGYTESVAVRIGMFRALVNSSSEYTDFEVPFARAGKPVVVTATDSIPKVIPKSAVCDTDGIVRVFWMSVPTSNVGSALSIVCGI